MAGIPYGKQHITNEDINAVVQALQAEYLTQGPLITAFENAFAEYVNCRFAVAVSNGTAALHICALALQVDSKVNVITTPITFAASANCIRYCNGNVFFADIDPNTYLLDIKSVETLIASKPAGFFHGIIPVDFAGRPVNMELFRNLADKHNLWIIEDACHAPGAYFTDSKGQKQTCGNGHYADMAIFSFHPVKHIACGEGGMITTNNEELYRRLLLFRTHGITKDPFWMQRNDGGWYYEMQTLGYNYRLTDVQAALGISQLKRANEGLARRKEIAAKYNEAFSKMPAITGHSGFSDEHAYHLYILQTADRKGLYDFLKSHEIFCQVHYIPVHRLPYYESLGWNKNDFPEAESYYETCLSLPMFPTLTNAEQEFVISKINEYVTA